MLDRDLAEIYGVSTRRLNEQVRRNPDRFPSDFAFVLAPSEDANLKSQFATSSPGWGGRRKLPLVFTEHGAVMAANVLNSRVAVQASIRVVRAFVRLREILATHKDLARRIDQLERKYDVRHKRHEVALREVFAALRALMNVQPEEKRRERIGFHRE